MIDMDDLVTRLLLYAEGSRRASKREKDMDEALIHQGRMLALIDAANYIKAQSTEMLRAEIAAIECTEFENARIKRLKSINFDLLAALLALSNAVDTTVDYLSLSTVCIPSRVTSQVDAAIARANETDEETP